MLFPLRKIPLILPLSLVSALAQQPRRVDDAVLRNAAKSGEDWLSYGFNQSETRYSPLNLINAGNVSQLGPAWSYDLGVGGGNQEATPLEFNGTIYRAHRADHEGLQLGSHAAGVQRNHLWDYELERGLRGRCAHGQGALALGP